MISVISISMAARRMVQVPPSVPMGYPCRTVLLRHSTVGPFGDNGDLSAGGVHHGSHGHGGFQVSLPGLPGLVEFLQSMTLLAISSQ